jgi:hypothetical protein
VRGTGAAEAEDGGCGGYAERQGGDAGEQV